MSAEAKDSLLLERAFLRIGSATTDEQFEALIGKLLVPIIYKLPSQYPNVRKKAIDLLTHISKRIRNRPLVQVPVVLLLKIYLEAPNQFVRNFSIVYIKLGFCRLSTEEKIESIPLLVNCIEDQANTESQKNSFIHLFLCSCKVFVDSQTTKQFLSSQSLKGWSLIKFVLEIFYDALLVPYSWNEYQQNNSAPPGMSVYTFKRICQDGYTDDFVSVKKGILNLLIGSDIPLEDKYIHYVVASIDTHADLISIGKEQVKQCFQAIEWTENNLPPLYHLFVGDTDRVFEDKRKKSADLRMKIILLPYLQKPHIYCWPECIKVVMLCLEETSNTKIRISGLNFGLSALQKAEISSFREVAPTFLKSLTEILWKRDTDEILRTLIYRLAGNVMFLNPDLVKYHKEIFPKFIEDLTEEHSPDVRNTIRDSLLKMACAFTQTEEPDTLLRFLVNRITSPEPHVKHIVIHYLHKVFRPDHVLSRFLLAWASADSDPNVRKEAELLLLEDLKSPKVECTDERVQQRVPYIGEIMGFVHKNCTAEQRGLKESFQCGDQNLILTNDAYVKIVLFLRTCLLYDCYPPLCTTKLEHPCSYSPKIGDHLCSLYDKSVTLIQNYLDFIARVVRKTNNIEALKCYHECLGTAPLLCLGPLWIDKDLFYNMLYTVTDEESNRIIASLLGIIFTYSKEDGSDLRLGLEELQKNFVKDKSETTQNTQKVEATLWCLSSIAERDGFEKIREIPLSVLQFCEAMLNHTSPTVLVAACHCIGQIGRNNDLPIPTRNLKHSVKYGEFDGLPTEHDAGLSSGEAVEKFGSITKHRLVERLLHLTVEKDVPYKVKMKAAEAVGFMCLGERNFPYRKLILNTIVERQNEEKDVATLLDLGDVLTDCIMGAFSIHTLNLWTNRESDLKLSKTWDSQVPRELFQFTFNKIYTDLISNEKCKSKASAALWLLMLMKRCFKLPLSPDEVGKIQYAFLELLSQNNEIIHDAATRGLSFVPRFSLDEKAVSNLAKQLTDKICLMHKSNSEIGAVLGMYREFCYLVASFKNHSLIYHFLNLLNHSNPKSDAKYSSAFEDHEEVSRDALFPYLVQVAPPLYVYKFHQSSKIKQAMNTIWAKLFPDNIKAVQTYSKAILEKSIPELIGPVSELRIAHCLAVEDLLRIEGNKFVSVHQQLMPSLLTNLYKIMDDIYESVRRVAYGTTKMYLQAFVQNAHRDKKSTATENELLNGILPILISVGVSSSVSDIQKLSFQILIDVIDHLGSLIKGHLHLLIPAMIENVSEIETLLRYVDAEQSRDVIDNCKEEIVSSHLSTEILKRCMQYIDEDVMEKLLPRLLELLKDTISFSTRTSAINFVILLTTVMDMAKLQPFVGKLLGALLTGLSHNNKNIRKNSAQAIGKLCKAAKDSSIDNLLTKLMQLIMRNAQDENIKSAVGQTLLAIASQCQDAVQARSEKIVPVIFFAMHLKKADDGSNDAHIELWNEVWNDVIGSTEVALSKHKFVIIEFLKTSFDSPSWTTKTQVARALTTFANKCPDDLKTCEELQLLVQNVISTLSGKFWHGKEELLDTVAALCASNKILSEESYVQILEAVLRECNRGNVQYQIAAMEALGRILTINQFHRFYFENIYTNLKTIILKDENDEDKSDYIDPEESSTLMNQRIKLKETAYSLLGKAWPEDEEIQARFQEEVITLLTDCLFKTTRLSQVSIMVALRNILSKLFLVKKANHSLQEEEILNRLLENIERALHYSLESKKHSLLKKESLHVMINLVEQCSENSNYQCLQRIANVYKDHINDLSKDVDPIIALQTSQLRDLLKNHVRNNSIQF